MNNVQTNLNLAIDELDAMEKVLSKVKVTPENADEILAVYRSVIKAKDLLKAVD